MYIRLQLLLSNQASRAKPLASAQLTHSFCLRSFSNLVNIAMLNVVEFARFVIQQFFIQMFDRFQHSNVLLHIADGLKFVKFQIFQHACSIQFDHQSLRGLFTSITEDTLLSVSFCKKSVPAKGANNYQHLTTSSYFLYVS